MCTHNVNQDSRLHFWHCLGGLVVIVSRFYCVAGINKRMSFLPAFAVELLFALHAADFP